MLISVLSLRACAHIGKPAPTFKGNAVVDGEFKEMKLSDYAGDYLVLYFYPYDFSPTCYNEIIGLSERVDDFMELNCKFVAVSTDSHYCHRAWYHSALKGSGLEYIIPLLADKNGSICNAFNVYSDITGVAQSSLFIIDEKNIVRHVQFIDANVQFSLDETFRLVQAFKYSDAHGAMCPSGWKPGDDAIKPTVESAKIFFEKHN